MWHTHILCDQVLSTPYNAPHATGLHMCSRLTCSLIFSFILFISICVTLFTDKTFVYFFFLNKDLFNQSCLISNISFPSFASLQLNMKDTLSLSLNHLFVYVISREKEIKGHGYELFFLAKHNVIKRLS